LCVNLQGRAMSERLQIKAVGREQAGRTASHIRGAGMIPAVLYGHKINAVNMAVEKKAFEKILPELSSSTLMNLNIEGENEPRTVLVSEVQRHPLTGNPIHVDFHQVNLKEEIEATVPLVFEGESFAVKDLGGTLVKSIDEIQVQAFPQDLPEEIKVDIGLLKSFEDRIKVSDLGVAKNVKVLTDGEEIVAVVTPPRSEAELEELEKEVEENAAEVKTEADEKKAAKEAEAAAEGSPDDKKESKE